MSKAYTDLDMNGNSITAAANITAIAEIRANTKFNHNGTDGITQILQITDDSAITHTLSFTLGILTAYSAMGIH